MSRWTIVVCVVFVASTAPAVLASQSGDARDQGRQAVERKPQKTKAEERIESGLLSAIERDERGEAAPSGRRAALDVDAKGRVLLDIRAEVTDALIQAIEKLGGVVVNRFPQYASVRARLPLNGIMPIAERDDVKFIRAAEVPVTNRPGR